MRFFAALVFGASLLIGTAAWGQSTAELRAQYDQTMQMLNEAEAAGVDPSLLSSLRESLEGIRQSIEEQEREESQAASAPDPEPVTEQPAIEAPAEENLAERTCSRFGFTLENYRQRALEDGNDQQIRAMCGQAYEYYTMYKRALAQKHPEAWRTYNAHKDAAAVVNNFYGETAVSTSSGIHPDTKTAVQIEAERREAEAQAIANAPPTPPPAPPCEGCATPQ